MNKDSEGSQSEVVNLKSSERLKNQVSLHSSILTCRYILNHVLLVRYNSL